MGIDVEEAVDWEITVTFTKTPVEPFLPCESSNGATGDNPAPEEYVIPEDSLIYTHEVMPDTWVFTDGLGRTSLTNADVGDPREDKTLAMFFRTWHTESFAYRTPFPLHDLSMKYPEAINDPSHETWSGITHHTFFWNESVYGFYRSTDEWVLRRQAELLADAGVDVIFTDNSNTDRIYREAYYTLYDTWTEATKWGYNFAEQWSNALKIDPQVIFITGWNDWQASRFQNRGSGQTLVKQGFLDTFNDEFSRDIEPTEGDLKDHYYCQLVNFARQYKGARPIPTPGAAQTIDLTAANEQWTAVKPYYAAYIGNTDDRDAQGYADHYYTETSGRNDIIGAQIARDDEYVWFHVECNENITPYTDSLWMTLYIDCNRENQGWNTFDFAVNKSPAGENTLVPEKFTAAYDYSKTEKVADVEYKADGKYMTVKIAKKDLGLSGNDYTANFARTDTVHDEGDYTKFSGDIMDFYISGDVAPGGRFKFIYISTEANSTVPDTGMTMPDTETVEQNNAPSSDVTEPTTEAAGNGCRSALTVGDTVLAAAATAVLARKKREEN